MRIRFSGTLLAAVAAAFVIVTGSPVLAQFNPSGLGGAGQGKSDTGNRMGGGGGTGKGATARTTTVKSSKSNTSDRMGGGGGTKAAGGGAKRMGGGGGKGASQNPQPLPPGGY